MYLLARLQREGKKNYQGKKKKTMKVTFYIKDSSGQERKEEGTM